MIPATGLGVAAFAFPRRASQAFVQFTRVVVRTPAAEEVVDRPPVREVDRQGHPLHAVVDEVAHGVEHLAMAVRLRAPAPLEEPGRHGHRGADLGPLGVRHVTGIAACPPPRSDRTEPVHVAVTPRGDRGGRRHRVTAQLVRQRASLVVLGVVTASLPRGPFFHARGRTRTSVQMITRCRTPRTRSGLPQRTDCCEVEAGWNQPRFQPAGSRLGQRSQDHLRVVSRTVQRRIGR